MHRVVVPFPCSWDGITLVDLAVGDERDFGSMTDGLVGLGWIEPAGAPLAAAATDQPVAEVPVDDEQAAPGAEPVEFTVNDEPIETAVVKRGRKRK